MKLFIGGYTDVVRNLGAKPPYRVREIAKICAMHDGKYLCEFRDQTRQWYYAEDVLGSGKESHGLWSWFGGITENEDHEVNRPGTR